VREPQPLGAGSRPGRWRPVTGVVLCLAAVVLGGRVVVNYPHIDGTQGVRGSNPLSSTRAQGIFHSRSDRRLPAIRQKMTEGGNPTRSVTRMLVEGGFGENTVIVHEGDLRRHAGLEGRQGAAQDAISQRWAGHLAWEDGPLHPETLARGGYGGRTGPVDQPSADLQPERATLSDLISEVAAPSRTSSLGLTNVSPAGPWFCDVHGPGSYGSTR
jgi:hypothetical protein